MSGYCMWRMDNNPKHLLWKSECGHEVNFYVENFKYCPYCGKEIVAEFPIKLGVDNDDRSTKV